MAKKKINSRRKGITGELEACKQFHNHGWKAERAQQHCGNVDAADILVDNLYQLKLHPEVKRVEQVAMQKWMTKCGDEAKEKGFDPLIIHRRNGEEWFATMRLDDMIRLLDEVLEHRALVDA